MSSCVPSTSAQVQVGKHGLGLSCIIENPKAPESLPGASQGPVLLKIGLNVQGLRNEDLGSEPSSTGSVCDTLDVFVPPAIVKSRESLFYVNFTARLKQQSFVSWRS